jgi:hypothetical protein
MKCDNCRCIALPGRRYCSSKCRAALIKAMLGDGYLRPYPHLGRSDCMDEDEEVTAVCPSCGLPSDGEMCRACRHSQSKRCEHLKEKMG